MKKHEPSKAMMERMAQVVPEKAAEEVLKLRVIRDNLMEALSLKLTDVVKTLKLEQNDILVVKRVGKVGAEEIGEVMQKVGYVLQTRFGWNGLILCGSKIEDVDKIAEEDARSLYRALGKRFEKTTTGG